MAGSGRLRFSLVLKNIRLQSATNCLLGLDADIIGDPRRGPAFRRRLALDRGFARPVAEEPIAGTLGNRHQ